MRKTNYDQIAATYDRRYETEQWGELEDALADFVGLDPQVVLEVGCGTGHWLQVLARKGHDVRGLDASHEMLARARSRLAGRDIRRGSAERLPWDDRSIDCVVCVHAFHHFPDKPGFLSEARRVLRPGGRLLIATLDPHQEFTDWCVYEYWDETLALDRARYPSIARVLGMMDGAGLSGCESWLIHRVKDEWSADVALAAGRLDKGATSQLAMLTDSEYERGRNKLRRAITEATNRNETLRIRAHLEVWAATGCAPT